HVFIMAVIFPIGHQRRKITAIIKTCHPHILGFLGRVPRPMPRFLWEYPGAGSGIRFRNSFYKKRSLDFSPSHPKPDLLGPGSPTRSRSRFWLRAPAPLTQSTFLG